jgi:uncharacterized protein (TIGR00299 family) protein
MMVAYVDCFAGASGDMILGALVDAGLELNALRDALAGLALADWELRAERIVTGGLSATRVNVITRDETQERRYTELDALVATSSIDEPVKTRATQILRRLAEIEARLHGVAIDQVHLHELGGIDTVIDVVGAVAGFRLLGIEEIFVSALPMGHGMVETRHGILPLPAPAVVELARGVPIRAVDLQAELVTPTGAAILTTLARGYGTFPPMTLARVGYGAGSRTLSIPNVLRLMLGKRADQGDATVETLVVLETNIDDMNPQAYEFVFGKLFAAGALDVWLTPIQMKKNRAATQLSALCRPHDADALNEIIFTQTTTLGVRRREVQRFALAREIVQVETRFGPVRVKVARQNGRVLRAMPEYDDCVALAEKYQIPFLEIYHVAESNARDAFGSG